MFTFSIDRCSMMSIMFSHKINSRGNSYEVEFQKQLWSLLLANH